MTRQWSKTKLLFTAESEGEAHMLRATLESQNINCSVQGGANYVKDYLPFMPEMQPQVWVLEDDYLQALDVLEDFLKADIEPATEEDWTCKTCGQTIEGQFTQCWNCQDSLPQQNDNQPTE